MPAVAQEIEAPTRCLECGADLEGKKSSFCSTAHRKAFNNRRMTRGASLYDAFMAFRYARGWAKAEGLFNLICRLASEWAEEDRIAGRPPEAYELAGRRFVSENKAWLRTIRMRLVR